MEHLSKHQLILVALLVSFVTALATGIVTVSLMNQAPVGVTRTINQIVEKTVEQIAPQPAAVGTVSTDTGNDLTSVINTISQSLVGIKDKTTGVTDGAGIVVARTGVILVDKSLMVGKDDYVAVLPDASELPVAVIQSQNNGDIAFLAPTSPIKPRSAFVPAAFGQLVKLGETVYSLSGTGTTTLGHGVITVVGDANASSSILLQSADPVPIGTSVRASATAVGSVLFDESGHVIGLRTSSLVNSSETDATFYPVNVLVGVIPTQK